MAYAGTNGVDPTYPSGSLNASDLDAIVQTVITDRNDRFDDVFGTDIENDDPLLPIKVGPSIQIADKQVKTLTQTNATLGATPTVNWNNGNILKGTLTANATFTFTNPVAGSMYFMELIQDATGGRTITLPSTVRWTNGSAIPTLITTANKVTAISMYYTGTRYLATLAGTGFDVS